MRLNSLNSRPPLFSALLVGIALTSFACQAKDVAPATSVTSDAHPAREGYRDSTNFCRAGSFPKSGSFVWPRLWAGMRQEPIFFNDDFDECPNVSLEKCKNKSYLIPGDQLVVANTYGDFICGWYSPTKGSSTVEGIHHEFTNTLGGTAGDAFSSDGFITGAGAVLGALHHWHLAVDLDGFRSLGGVGGLSEVRVRDRYNGGSDRRHR